MSENWERLAIEEDREMNVNLGSIARAEYVRERNEEILYLYTHRGNRLFLPLDSCKSIFNALSQKGDLYKLDGRYASGADYSALLALDKINHIVSSAKFDRNGKELRAVTISTNQTYINGLALEETDYQALIKDWKAAKHKSLIHVLPETASARFNEPGEAYFDANEVFAIEQRDSEIDLVFNPKGARIDFKINEQVYLRAAWDEVQRQRTSTGIKVSGEQQNVIAEFMADKTAKEFIAKLLPHMPQLTELPCANGSYYQDVSSLVAVSAHSKGYSMYFDRASASVDIDPKTIFFRESQQAEIQAAADKVNSLLKNIRKAPKP